MAYSLTAWNPRMGRGPGRAAMLLAALALCSAPARGEWNSATLHHFEKKPDGQLPWGGMVLGWGGALYTTATAGGDYGYIHNNQETTDGFGTIVRVIPPAKGQTSWTTHVIHEFTGGGDGKFPYGSLVGDAAGNLYGITGVDINYFGSVFELSPPKPGAAGWTFRTLHFFTGKSDGGSPYGDLAIDAKGMLYGTTNFGGQGCNGGGCGVVFRMVPPAKAGGSWTEQVLYAFGGTADGSNPEAGVTIGPGGVLYGTTTFGGGNGDQSGTVYSLAPPAKGSLVWHFQLLHTFSGRTDGGMPFDAPILDAKGALYGTTVLGGAFFEGTVFKLSPPAVSGKAWTETVLHNFGEGSDGSVPHGGLVFDKAGALYGTAYAGGSHGLGMVFKLAPPTKGQPAWVETELKGFAGGADGDAPNGKLMFDASGALYGTSSGDDFLDYGTVFQLTP